MQLTFITYNMAFIHQQIKELLDRKKPTKTSVAKSLSIERPTLMSWGNATYPKVDKLIELARVYKVPISYFFEGYNSTYNNIVNGDGSVASINGNAIITTNNRILEEKLEDMKLLLNEKERIIQILLTQLQNIKL